MCQGRQCYSVCLHFVLIAMAIQGVTPDAQDLASVNALRFFCAALAGSNPSASDDGLPDEVCGPAWSEMALVLHRRRESIAPGFHTMSTENQMPTDCSIARWSDTCGVNMIRFDNLISSMCRLNC